MKNTKADSLIKYLLDIDDLHISEKGALAYYDNGVERPFVIQPEFKTTNKKIFKELGFESQLDFKTFERLSFGIDANGEPIKPKNSSNSSMGFDFTFNAPKSISSLMALLPPEQAEKINELFMQSVDDTMQELPDLVALSSMGKTTLDEHGQVKATMVQADIAYINFNHFSNRNVDPHLHCHSFVPNFVRRKSDGKYLNLNTDELMKSGDNYRDILGNIQRNRFVELLRENFDFKIQNGKDAFEVDGLPLELIETWSSRKNEILAEAARTGLESAKANKVHALTTRANKGEESNDVTNLRQDWQATYESLQAEFGFEDKISEVFKPKTKKQTVKPSFESVELQKIFERATENQAFFSERDLIKATLREIEPLGLSREDRRALISKVFGDFENENSNLIYLREEKGVKKFTIKEMMAIEKRLNDYAGLINERSNHAIPVELLDKHIKLVQEKNGFPYTENQIKNIRHIALNNDLSSVQGKSGAGKSTILEPVVNALNEQGKKVYGVAISGKVSADMSELSLEASTIDALLMKLEKAPLDKNSVIIVDESAMVGSRHAEKILRHVAESEAKLILIGDVRQLQPVSAGNPMAELNKSYPPSQLNEVYRHKLSFGEAVNHAIADRDSQKAIQTLLNENRVSVSHDVNEMREKMADKFFEHYKQGDVNSSLMIASTNSSVEQLNQIARNRLIEQGIIDNENSAKAVVQNGQNELLGFREFAKNDHVVFLKNAKDENGEKIFNGNIGVVESIDRLTKEMTVKLQSGQKRTVNLNTYNKVDHAYAITTHKSQGATFDNVVAEWGSFQDAHSSYVALTRQKKELDVFVSHKQIEQYKMFKECSEEEQLKANDLFGRLPKQQQIEAIENVGYCKNMSLQAYEDFIVAYGSEVDKKEILEQSDLSSLKKMVEQTGTENIKLNANDLIVADKYTQSETNFDLVKKHLRNVGDMMRQTFKVSSFKPKPKLKVTDDNKASDSDLRDRLAKKLELLRQLNEDYTAKFYQAFQSLKSMCSLNPDFLKSGFTLNQAHQEQLNQQIRDTEQRRLELLMRLNNLGSISKIEELDSLYKRGEMNALEVNLNYKKIVGLFEDRGFIDTTDATSEDEIDVLFDEALSELEVEINAARKAKQSDESDFDDEFDKATEEVEESKKTQEQLNAIQSFIEETGFTQR